MSQPALVNELLRRPRYEVFPLEGIEDEVGEHVPRDVKMTVTSSPKRGIEATLRLSEELATRGFDVGPHLATRLVADTGHLSDIVERLRAVGVREVLVIGGDVRQPIGRFASSAELLAALDDLGHPFDEIGIAGYPESHPFISDEGTIQAMFDKAPFATYVVSQLCLDPRVIAGWIRAVRKRGVTLPIYVGIPGVIPRRKLLRISTRIGVGESTRFLRKHGNVIGRLLLRGNMGPGYLVDGLARLDTHVAALHVYTFNELAETERWRQERLAHLDRLAA
jgi:methylenetetrahydrofolate reductase (NADPH)